MKYSHILLACLSVVLSFNYAQADVLDQAAVMRATTNGWAISDRNAQTVTVGVAGILSQVEVQIYQSDGGASGDLWVEIFDVAADGSPDTTMGPLGAALLQNSDIPFRDDVDDGAIVLTSANLLPAQLSFAVGDQFAIVLNRTDQSSTGSTPWMIWSGGSSNFPNDYAGGSFYLDGVNGWEERGGDHGFRTFMSVPEPGSLGILCGMSLLFARRRRQA